MGLLNFPSSAQGVLPVLVMNTVLFVALLKNMLSSVLQVMGAIWNSNLEEDPDGYPQENGRERRISTTQFKSLCGVGGWEECCVCLCTFGAEEEVSELSCKHFFHKGCLDKWFDNKNSTCPLCRSIH